MDYIIKFIMALCEISITQTLNIDKKEFSFELFHLFLKKNAYNILTSDDRLINIQETINNIRLNYDFLDSESEDSISIDDTEEDINNYNKDDIKLTIDIPLDPIIEEIKNGIDSDNINENHRELLRDINIIDEIWESWNPIDEFSIIAKKTIDFIT